MRNKVGLITPPWITPCPIFTSSSWVLILVCLYSHSIVLTRSSLSPRFLILSKRISWFTVSNADLRSMKVAHNLASYLLSYFSLIYSVILNKLTLHPIPFLNPVWLSFSFHLWFSFSSFYSLWFRIVSKSLYIGEVFVIGRAFMKVFQLLLSFGM